VVVCTAADKKKVVVLGGTGRVGSATAASLLENFADVYDVSVAGRSRENFEKIMKLRPKLKGAQYVACDITDLESVKVRAPLDAVDTLDCRDPSMVQSSMLQRDATASALRALP